MGKSCFDCKNSESGWCTHFGVYILGDPYLSDYYYGIDCDASRCRGFRDRNSGGSSGSGCFLTSACVSYMGKEDDCYELTTLRTFRDGYMKGIDDGEELIKEYYDVAPRIVEKIDSNENRESYYKYIYSVVTECIEHIKKEENQTAVEKYTEMVKTLRNKLSV